MYDYGARFYDPQLGRFHTVDPLAETFDNQSPFVYAMNNPILLQDFMGMGPDTTNTASDVAPEQNNNDKTLTITFGDKTYVVKASDYEKDSEDSEDSEDPGEEDKSNEDPNNPERLKPFETGKVKDGIDMNIGEEFPDNESPNTLSREMKIIQKPFLDLKRLKPECKKNKTGVDSAMKGADTIYFSIVRDFNGSGQSRTFVISQDQARAIVRDSNKKKKRK